MCGSDRVLQLTLHFIALGSGVYLETISSLPVQEIKFERKESD